MRYGILDDEGKVIRWHGMTNTGISHIIRLKV